MSSAQTELNTLIANWGERVGIPAVPARPSRLRPAQRTQRSHPADGAAAGPDPGQRRALDLGSAGGGRLRLADCANLANLLLARASSRGIVSSPCTGNRCNPLAAAVASS